MGRPLTLLAHPGTQHSLYLARELERHDLLSGFHTCLAMSAESNFARLFQPFTNVLRIERQWQHRLLEGVPPGKLSCYPYLEVEAWRRRRKNGSEQKILRERNDRFQRKISDKAFSEADAVIGFDTSSQILARRAVAFGKTFILERSIAHPRAFTKVATALRTRFPEWMDTSESKTEIDLALEDEEHHLARLIVVPSTFVAQTLEEQGVAREKIRINPFGTDTRSFCPEARPRAKSPLIFLFVGALSARKGLPLLLQAWRRVKPTGAELWIAGTGHVPEEEIRNAPPSVRWLGGIPRRNLPALFQEADVFVFPSFFEGLALVQLEAAACGLPIIATNASGGEDIVEEGETGFIVEAGNMDQLVQRIDQFIKSPSLVEEMKERARTKAGDWSWSAYGDRWRKILQENL